MTDSVRIQFNVPVPMRDGVTLRANVLWPEAAGPWPVAVMRTPYGKDFATANAICDTVRLARAGFIVVVQDMRGRFASEGDFDFPPDDRNDGYDTVEWAARLPGSSGRVGMFGASFSGIAQWSAARANPPHLAALVPTMAPADPLDGVVWRGGALELGLLAYWQLGNSFDRVLRRTDLEAVEKFLRAGAAVYELDHLPSEGYFELPLAEFPPLHRIELGADLERLFQHANEPAYLESLSVDPERDALDVPALLVTGWYDLFVAGTLQNFAALRARGVPAQLVVGPWAHSNTHSVVGDTDFGFGADMGFMNLQNDLTSLTATFLNRHLKGQVDEPAAPLQLFVMGENYWREEDEWPLARTRYGSWFLHSNGHANGANGDGALDEARPGEEPPDRYFYDPGCPVRTDGGAFLMNAVFHPGVRDQRGTEARDDVLIYTSPPLERDLEVTGPVAVHLFATTDAPDTDFVARLVDVHPDGFARNLTDGILRARYRHGNAPEPLEPGQVEEYIIDLWATSNVFRAGHRIRVDVTSSNFPRWDRNPNTGAPPGQGTELRVARQTILHDAAHPSHIVLPVIPR